MNPKIHLVILGVAVVVSIGASIVVLAAGVLNFTRRKRMEKKFSRQIEKFRKRERPTKLTLDLLRSLEGWDLEMAICDYVDHRMTTGDGDGKEIFASLPAPVQYVFATIRMEGEINNGGFDQFFFNSSRFYAREALEGLRAIGAHRSAALLEEAMARLEEKAPGIDMRAEEGLIQNYMRWSEHLDLDDLDTKFYELDRERSERLSTLREQYIRERLEEFVSQET